MPADRTSADPAKRYARRRHRLLRRCRKDHAIGAMLITAGQDVRYLSGFTGDDSWLLIEQDRTTLLTDGRYSEQAGRECPRLEFHVRSGPISRALGEVVKGRSLRRIGLQGEAVTLACRERLSKALGSRTLVSITSPTGPMRMIKDDDEQARIRHAGRIAIKAFRELIGQGRSAIVGRTERDLAGELDYRMRQHGADGPAFETIVAAGATASLPHYRPGNRRIRSDQAVLVDWGAVVGGYRSDLTRVFFTGTIPPKIKTIYPVVLKAQQSAIAAIRPGVHGSTVDAAAREIIGKGGYGEQFLHGTGHGVGLDIHEGPTLGRTARTPLRAGMIVTVEPGIYLPRIGGVRIEDDVLVTSDGARRVTSLTSRMKDLIVG